MGLWNWIKSKFGRGKKPVRGLSVYQRDIARRSGNVRRLSTRRGEKAVVFGKSLINALNKFNAQLESGCTEENLDKWKQKLIRGVSPQIEKYFDFMVSVKNDPYLEASIGRPDKDKLRSSAYIKELGNKSYNKFLKRTTSYLKKLAAFMQLQVNKVEETVQKARTK